MYPTHLFVWGLLLPQLIQIQYLIGFKVGVTKCSRNIRVSNQPTHLHQWKVVSIFKPFLYWTHNKGFPKKVWGIITYVFDSINIHYNSAHRLTKIVNCLFIHIIKRKIRDRDAYIVEAYIFNYPPPLNNKTAPAQLFNILVMNVFFPLKNEEKHKNAGISTIDSWHHTNQSQRPRLNFYIVGVILCLSIYGKDFV